MVEITRETLNRLYNRNKRANSFARVWSFAAGGIIGIIIVVLRFFPSSVRPFLLCLIVLLFVSPLIFVRLMRGRVLPEGYGKNYIEASKLMWYDFMSDSTVHMLMGKINETYGFAEKTRLTLMLADTYRHRGQHNEAFELIRSVDITQFPDHPDIGLLYYNYITDLYDDMGDSESILSAYADAELLLMECAEKNYLNCLIAVNLIICGEKNKGNYQKALELRLMLNDFHNRNVSDSKSSPTPYLTFDNGIIMYETAELFYLCGDYKNAAYFLDTGGPMLSASAYETELANRLSAKISEKLHREESGND